MSAFRVMPFWEILIEAAGLRCEVVIAKDNELQFDLDSLEDELKCSRLQVALMERYGCALPVAEWWSKSRLHKHVVVTLPYPMHITQRIALQAAGGSDPLREYASLCCFWDEAEHPVLLYKPLPLLLPATTN